MTAASTPREVMAAALYNAAWQGGITGTVTGTAWDVAQPSEREPYYRRIDRLLSALTEAGWELTKLERVGKRSTLTGDLIPTLDAIVSPWEPLYRKLIPQEEEV